MLSRPDLLRPVLRAATMREADRRTMDEWHLPGRALMETAGRACADAVERLASGGFASGTMGWSPEATVLAGKGNNGGDGLVIARVLHARGWHVRVLTTASGDDATPDTAANLAMLQRLERDSDRLSIAGPDGDGGRPDIVVDALLGIGISGELREPVASLAAWATRQRPCARVFAVDVPTGLDADTGRAASGAVHADATLAMGALKAGLLLGDGSQIAGAVGVAEIGIPDRLLREHADAWTASGDWLGTVLPRRAPGAHKYSAGRAVCVVGSRAYTGAAVLATRAASRSGAGAVVACTPTSAQATIDAHNAEVMVDAQPETDDGALSITAYDGIRQRLDAADAVLLGCGLGREKETHRLVRALMRRVGAEAPPAVLDADGLGAFAGDTGPLAERAGGRVLLTPHLGELRRLLGDDDFSPEDRISTVRDLATEWHSVLLLKGMPSVIGAPDGTVAIGPPGHPALATAGTGDVLAGTACGLMAQGLSPQDAALAALHLGYRAACRWPGRPEAMVAGDLLSPTALASGELRPSPEAP
ncbi:MAG: NAD(P)H-hydrate dehydratase [Bacteroidota bacterium]